MLRLLPILYVSIGAVLGFSAALFISHSSDQHETTEHPIAETKVEVPSVTPANCPPPPLAPDSAAAQNPTSVAESAQIPETASSSTPSASQLTCPVCPCLYSDAILDPPNFDSRMKETIETNHEGEALVRWIEVRGAKKYSIHVETENNKTVKIYKSARSFLYLKDIPLPEGKMEADYWIRLGTLNGKDEEGQLGPKRHLRVKPQASVMAPVIQEIKVED